jgi:hypothetical protein
MTSQFRENQPRDQQFLPFARWVADGYSNRSVLSPEAWTSETTKQQKRLPCTQEQIEHDRETLWIPSDFLYRFGFGRL